MAYKTVFTPKNRKKYIGNSERILCRSLWERKMCKYLDENTNIHRWGFETIKIPYLSPIDNKVHQYIPDFIVETLNHNKETEITIIEIKPKKQTKDPSTKKRKTLQECVTYSINKVKWEHTLTFCEKRGWKFKIITEKELF